MVEYVDLATKLFIGNSRNSFILALPFYTDIVLLIKSHMLITFFNSNAFQAGNKKADQSFQRATV